MAREPARAGLRLSPDRRTTIIMQAARTVLAERGYEQFLPAEVAERCGISEATIYRYFPTRRDLLVRVAEAWFDELLAEDVPPTRPHGTRARLQYLIWRCLSIIRQERALTRFVLMELRSDPGYRSMQIYQLNRRFTAGVLGVLKAAVAEGSFADDVPLGLLRDMVFGAIEHQTWAWLRGEGDFSVEDTANGIAEVICRGMGIAANPQLDALEAQITRLEIARRGG